MFVNADRNRLVRFPIEPQHYLNPFSISSFPSSPAMSSSDASSSRSFVFPARLCLVLLALDFFALPFDPQLPSSVLPPRWPSFRVLVRRTRASRFLGVPRRGSLRLTYLKKMCATRVFRIVGELRLARQNLPRVALITGSSPADERVAARKDSAIIDEQRFVCHCLVAALV